MLLVLGRGDQSSDLFTTQRFGQMPGTLHRHSQLDLPPNDFSKEEVDGDNLMIARTIGELLFEDQEVHVVADLFGRDPIWRPPLVAGKLFQGLDVTANRGGGLASQLEFTDHSLTQWGHEGAPFKTGNTGLE
jgi:hypothetical protein